MQTQRMYEVNESRELSADDALHEAAAAINNRIGANDPNVVILVAAMRSAVKRRDIKYFKGTTFHFHCIMLGLDHDMLKKIILKRLDNIE